MANEHAFFYKSENGDRVYDDASFEHWLKKFFTSGVFMNDLQVTANDDMTVTVGTGYVNADGKVKVYEEATTLQLETAGATYPRIDSIVLERNDAERDIILKVITGGYSSNPTAHLPVRQDGVYQLVVAQVLVSAGATKITQANITDTRAYKNLCGMVTSAVDQMDYGQVQAQFDDWFAHVRGQLDEDAAGNLQNQVDTIKAEMLYRPNLLVNGDFQVNQRGKTTYTNEEAVDKWVCDANATLEVVEDGVILKGPSARLTQTLTGQVETGERHTITISVDGVPYSYNCKVYQNLEMASNVTDNVKVEINGTTMAIELIGECLDTTINYIRVDKGDVAYPHVKEDYEIALARCGVISNLSNPNLLINGDFRNPINQSGVTEHLGGGKYGYTLDQWCGYNPYEIEVVKGSHTKITATVYGTYFQQFLEDVIVNGETYTISACIDGNVVSRTFTGGEVFEDMTFKYAKRNENICSVALVLQEKQSINVQWIKLEQGSVATPFVPRLYGEELALCQRYYYEFNGRIVCCAYNSSAMNGNILFPVEMRIAPTYTFVDSNYYDGDDNAWYTPASNVVSSDYHTTKGTTINFNKNTNTVLSVGKGYNVSLKVKFDARIY